MNDTEITFTVDKTPTLKKWLSEMLDELDRQATEHTHTWYELGITDEQSEQINWCTGCDASKDSCGNIVE